MTQESTDIRARYLPGSISMLFFDKKNNTQRATIVISETYPQRFLPTATYSTITNVKVKYMVQNFSQNFSQQAVSGPAGLWDLLSDEA